MAKFRQGFISNSSSSSFIVISSDKRILKEDGDPDVGDSEFLEYNIDDLINMLVKEKEKGAKTITIEYGGGYDG